MIKRFHLEREVDVSGVSGCGAVAVGVMFGDGQVVLHWESSLSSINIYHSIQDLINIHGHEGATKVVWDD